MDPAALLDPRGARRRQAAQQSVRPTPTQQMQQQQYFSPQFQRPPQQLQQAPPQFQFTHPDPHVQLNPQQTKRPAADPVIQEPGRGRDAESSQPGQYSLVERLHNVHERTASPAKRMKTDGTMDARKSSSNPAHHGSGVLNLKNAQQQDPAQTTKAPAIDLTMSDDDDVQCVQDNSSQVICIGRPKQLYVQSHMVPFPDPNKYQGNNGHRIRIKVTFRRTTGGSHQSHNKIMVVDPTGKEFGRIDSVSAQHIAPLMDGSNATGLLWQAWTEPRNRNQNDGPPGSPSSALIGLTMQLYCPRKNAHNIGQYLAARKVSLAAPMWELDRYDYFNPQTHESIPRDVAEQPGYMPPAQQYAPGVGSNYVMRSVDEIRSDVQTMFDTMINSEDIAEREPSPLVLTKLYKHQKQALWFMWHKEQDWQGEKGDEQKDSLWQPKYRNNGAKYYVHVITGEERTVKPASCQGGILADEMGLGKTLSILSLVADTDSMAAARQFGSQNPAPSREHKIQPHVNSRATLLVCPLSTMYNWKSQLEVHFPRGQGGLKWANYHGKSRSQFSVKDLADHDLVITTYHMIQADFLNQSAILPHVNWFRIVLDEAHTIRNANTKQSIAACSLAAQRRWAVTGTPVQNRLEDLGALFKFLHLHPFSTHGFNQHILSPFKNADPDVVPKLQLLVSSITLRRVKKNVLEVEIPPRHDSIVRLQFSKDEQRLHDWFESDSARKVNAVTSGDKLGGHSYARILTAITNLRLICAHGRDLLSDEALKMTDGMTYDNPVELDDDGADSGPPELSRAQAYDMLDLLESMGNDQCQYCRENICHTDNSDDDEEGGSGSDTLGWMTPCYQVVCAKHAGKLSADMEKNLQADGFVLCPFCPTRIRPVPFKISLSDFNTYLEERDRNRRNPKLAKKMGGYTGPSTKVQALLEDLAQHKAWSDAHLDEPPIKSVVFSTWTTHLDLIQLALENHRFKYVRLDGRMPREARNRALTAFDNDNNVHIILVSIGAGGLGLNLTKANKAFVMEPQFNPAAEAQAVDRVHRLGQKRPVEIKRFIMEGSFEEKMLELQRKKMELADLTMSRERGSKEQAAKQRLEDLRSLFK